MTDTVQKLMALADEYMVQERDGANGHEARQVLKDELVKLLTPPSKPEAREYKPCAVCGGALELESNGYNTFPRCNQCGHVPVFDREGNDIAARLKLAQMESGKLRGITGESK